MVANAQARAEQLKDLAATAVAPNAQHVFALLLAENNEVQNSLAQVTAGAKVDSVVQELQNRLGFSDARKEMIRDAMVAAASMAVGGKAGRRVRVVQKTLLDSSMVSRLVIKKLVRSPAAQLILAQPWIG